MTSHYFFQTLTSGQPPPLSSLLDPPCVSVYSAGRVLAELLVLFVLSFLFLNDHIQHMILDIITIIIQMAFKFISSD
jgi:hypothetical protein